MTQQKAPNSNNRKRLSAYVFGGTSVILLIFLLNLAVSTGQTKEKVDRNCQVIEQKVDKETLRLLQNHIDKQFDRIYNSLERIDIKIDRIGINAPKTNQGNPTLGGISQRQERCQP